MLLNLQIVLCWFFVSACHLFCCDLPRVFNWRNSLPIVHLFVLSNPGEFSILYYIFFIVLVTCQLSQSQWKPGRNRIYIYIYIYMSCFWHGFSWLSLAVRLYHSSLPAGLLWVRFYFSGSINQYQPYIYIYIYFFKKKQRNQSQRIINLFPSCYAFLKFSNEVLLIFFRVFENFKNA